MRMRRLVEPELLDELPAADPFAQGSRHDLVRLNAWMGHAGILARQLQGLSTGPPPRRLLDLGSGDGRFMGQVAKRLPQSWQGTSVDLLDRQAVIAPQVCQGLAQLGWQAQALRADVTLFLSNAPEARWSVICTNLFLHHFAETPLRNLLQLVAEHASAFVALEPRRSWWPLLASRMVGLIGCNRVTRHDAPASVRAGFNGRALSELWPQEGSWMLEERRAGLFSHLFVARRNGASHG